MIETLTLRNYKGHTDTTVACDRLTVLVGENASGKTSVLQAAQWISSGIGETLPAELLRRGAAELEIALSQNTPAGTGQIRAVYQRKEGEEKLVRTAGVVENEDGSVGRRPHAISLSLRSEELAAPSRVTSVRLELGSSGRGLASLLAYLKLADTDRFARVVDRLRTVVPIVRDIGFSRVEVNETISRHLRVEDRVLELPETTTSIQDVLLFDFADAARVPASLVSEGTLLALGMLTALETLDRDTRLESRNGVSVLQVPADVILIDDIDRALHPRAQRSLIATLRAILDVTHNLQILATSHSPYLVDSLRPEEVIVLGRDAAGTILAKRLDAFPDERLRKMLSAGELWMSEGDEWVTR